MCSGKCRRVFLNLRALHLFVVWTFPADMEVPWTFPADMCVCLGHSLRIWRCLGHSWQIWRCLGHSCGYGGALDIPVDMEVTWTFLWIWRCLGHSLQIWRCLGHSRIWRVGVWAGICAHTCAMHIMVSRCRDMCMSLLILSSRNRFCRVLVAIILLATKCWPSSVGLLVLATKC